MSKIYGFDCSNINVDEIKTIISTEFPDLNLLSEDYDEFEDNKGNKYKYHTFLYQLGWNKLTLAIGHEPNLLEENKPYWVSLTPIPWWRQRWNPLPKMVLSKIIHLSDSQ